MLKLIEKTIKATILNIIVAFFIIMIIIFTVDFIFGAKIKTAVTLASKITIDLDNKEEPKEIIIDENKKIKNYPEYGTQYATIEIPKINVNLPVYFGDTLEILKKGVGHSSRKLFSRRRWIYCIYGS